MYELIEVACPDDRRRFCELPCTPDLSATEIEGHHPDASWLAVDDAGQAAARCSLWWRQTPALRDHRPGLIGHYAAQADAAAGQLLRRACDVLAGHGCTIAIGPMDGSTWHRYRLITERGPEPIFFLEPDNPGDWPSHFTSAGFTPLAQYHSALNSDLTREDPRIAEAARRLEESGIRLRPLNLERFEEELRAICALCLASFCDNFLYTPIAEDEFMAQYQPVRRFVQSELVLLAEQQGRLIGFIFGIPDLNQARRGRPIDTMLIKTMAVHPEYAGVGLGGLLMARCQQAARQLGYRRVIHALMHESNRSGRISTHTAHVMRTYTLFAREIAADCGQALQRCAVRDSADHG